MVGGGKGVERVRFTWYWKEILALLTLNWHWKAVGGRRDEGKEHFVWPYRSTLTNVKLPYGHKEKH